LAGRANDATRPGNFKAEGEWKRVKEITKSKHGVLVGEIEDRTLNLTDYSASILQAKLS